MKKMLLIISLLTSNSLLAADAYVTDQFRITVRSGETSGHRIIRMLPTGSKVNVLSRNEESGYSKVRLPSREEGFVLSRQLLNAPVARDRIPALEAQISALNAAPGELRGQLSALTREHHSLQAAHKELNKIKTEIEQELVSLQRTSANAMRIANERKELRKQTAQLTRELEDVKQTNRELENSQTQSWFMIGAAVLVGGIILGLILPHLRVKRRKNDWGSL